MNKYQEALDELSFPLYDSSCGGCKCGTSDCQDCEKAQAVFTLEQLINEHFDNPPLKFEDLHDEMWIWDNKYKEYCYIGFIAGKFLHRKYIDNCESDSEFEENRFYRYEVKEE